MPAARKKGLEGEAAGLHCLFVAEQERGRLASWPLSVLHLNNNTEHVHDMGLHAFSHFSVQQNEVTITIPILQMRKQNRKKETVYSGFLGSK